MDNPPDLTGIPDPTKRGKKKDDEERREDRPNPAEGGGFEPRTAAPKSGRVPGGGEPKVPGRD
jgi:hypothetical protein